MGDKRIGGVIVSHGQLATELLSAAETVIGNVSHIAAVSIGWHDDVDVANDQVQRAIESVSQGAGVLVLTDMFGGTPTNIAAMFYKADEVDVITGVNLPMVIKLASNTSDLTLAELSIEVESQGKRAIHRTGALLEPQTTKDAHV